MQTSLLWTSLGPPALAEQITGKTMIANGAEGFQDDELHGSKEKKKGKTNGDPLSENLQVMNEIQEKPSIKKKKKKKKTDGDEAKTEEEMSEIMVGFHEDGIAEKHKKKLKKTDGDEAKTEEEISEKRDGFHEDGIAEKHKKKKKKTDGDDAKTEEEISEESDGFHEDGIAEKHKKKKKKTDGDDAKTEEEISEERDGFHEDGIAEKHKKKKKKTDGDEAKREEDISEKRDGFHEDGIVEKHKKKKEKKKSGEVEIEVKLEIVKQEEITSIPDLEIREKAPKKKKKKRAEGNGIEVPENLHEGIAEGTSKEEHNTEKSHKKKKKKKEKRAEGNGIVKVENLEEGIEDVIVKEEDNTEKSPMKTKKNSEGEDFNNAEEKEKRIKKMDKSNEREGYDIVEFKEKKSSEGEDYDKVEEKEKRTKKRKRGESVSENNNCGESSPAERSPPNKKQRKVTFSDQVEVFLIEDKKNVEKSKDGRISIAASGDDSNLVWGKRFSKAEDQAIRNAVSAYIQEHGFEEKKGIHMILNGIKNPEVRNCWKEIAAALPWRPLKSVYLRTHILYERSEEPGWTKDEIDTLKRLQAVHGNNWKKIAEFLGKSRYHVKDKWRRIKRAGLNSGHWSQDEYQRLFDLVNQDLQLKSLQKEEKLSRNVLRDNINWEAIADRMGTRDHVYCCKKWYYGLASPMVQNGEWENADDITLLRSLLETNATDEEAVDWNALVEGRSSVACLKRWRQMVKHLGECYNKPFLEKLEMLVKRYIPDLIE